MIFILLLITIIPFIIDGIVIHNDKKNNEYGVDFDDFFCDHICLFILSTFSGIAFGGVLLALFFVSNQVVEGGLVDEKIAVVQEQNTEIENKVKIVVENYLVHESSTYESLKPDDAMVAATMYPALQSNQVVQEQLRVYEENNKKIVSLREEKINAKVARWWLYFGN